MFYIALPVFIYFHPNLISKFMLWHIFLVSDLLSAGSTVLLPSHLIISLQGYFSSFPVIVASCVFILNAVTMYTGHRFTGSIDVAFFFRFSLGFLKESASSVERFFCKQKLGNLNGVGFSCIWWEYQCPMFYILLLLPRTIKT